MSRLFKVKFWILVVLSVPSVICSTLIFIYFYNKEKNLPVHHQFTLLLIIISFLQITTDLPFAIIYYYYEEVIPASNFFCLWWNWWDYSLCSLLIFVMAWGSIQRHLLVFHNSIMSTRRKRIIFHISPMLIICAYPLIFYLAIIIFNSCKNNWDYTMLLCIQPCYLIAQPTLGTYDFLSNIAFPVAIITLANAYLIVRVVQQKRFHGLSGARQRQLALPLLYVAIVYIIIWIPVTLNGLILTFTSSPIALNLQANYLFFLVYLLPIILPFVSLPFLPNFTRTIFRRRKRCIAPLPHIALSIY